MRSKSKSGPEYYYELQDSGKMKTSNCRHSDRKPDKTYEKKLKSIRSSKSKSGSKHKLHVSGKPKTLKVPSITKRMSIAKLSIAEKTSRYFESTLLSCHKQSIPLHIACQPTIRGKSCLGPYN